VVVFCGCVLLTIPKGGALYDWSVGSYWRSSEIWCAVFCSAIVCVVHPSCIANNARLGPNESIWDRALMTAHWSINLAEWFERNRVDQWIEFGFGQPNQGIKKGIHVIAQIVLLPPALTACPWGLSVEQPRRLRQIRELVIHPDLHTWNKIPELLDRRKI
jgi:hypothetical protein